MKNLLSLFSDEILNLYRSYFDRPTDKKQMQDILL